MALIFTRAAHHLAAEIAGKQCAYQCTQFHDGELQVSIDPSISKQEVTVITATNPPGDHIVELFLLLSALAQQQCTVHLVFTYFGYARQDHPEPGVAPAAAMLGMLLKQFPIARAHVVHPHSARLHDFFEFESFIPFDTYAQLVKELGVDLIIAPDKGAQPACQRLALQANVPVAYIYKTRTGIDQVKTLSLEGNVHGKNALIFDDMVSTGSTLIQAAELLMKNGATNVSALATHGLIDQETIAHLANSPIKHLYITNSITQTFSDARIRLIDIASPLRSIIN